jgi:hypothetical protein
LFFFVPDRDLKPDSQSVSSSMRRFAMNGPGRPTPCKAEYTAIAHDYFLLGAISESGLTLLELEEACERARAVPER